MGSVTAVSNGAGLARVTVVASRRRVDLALPEDIPVAALLPRILPHLGPGAADGGERHGGWVLRHADGARIDPAGTLRGQAVVDGELLHLVPARAGWPEPEVFDDIAEAIATAAGGLGRSWDAAATRRCGLLVGTVTLGLAPLSVLTAGPPWAAVGWLLLVLALGAGVAGAALARAAGDPVAGAAVVAGGLPAAFFGGALTVARHRHPVLTGGAALDLTAGSLLVGSAALLALVCAGYAATGVLPALFAGGAWVSLLGLVSGVVAVSSPAIRAPGAAAVVLVVGLGLLPAYPAAAVRLGRVPVPALPAPSEAGAGPVEDSPDPPLADVIAAVARADGVLTGLLAGSAVVVPVCAAALSQPPRPSPAGLVLVGVAALALALRARAFAAPRQRVPLIAGGAAATVVLVARLSAALRPDGGAQAAALLAEIAAGAAVLIAGGLAFSRRAPTPVLGRLSDLADAVAVAALVPLALGPLGIYHHVTELTSRH